MPFFSIIIPLYNKQNHIKNTLKSVLEQRFTDFEIIIIDDGSTDNSLQQAKQIIDTRITIIAQKNQGVSKARNHGVEKAKAKYLAFLDADDYWYPWHLEQLHHSILQFPKAGLYANGYQIQHTKDIKTTAKHQHIAADFLGIVPHFFKSSLPYCIAWTSAVCMPKAIVEKHKGFDSKITLGAGEDTDLWVKAALHHPVVFCATPSAIHNQIADNRITNSNTLKRHFWDMDKYQKYTDKHMGLAYFLDQNRFSIALQYKLAGDNARAKKYHNKITLKNLNISQKIILFCPKVLLIALKKIQLLLLRYTIRVSLY